MIRRRGMGGKPRAARGFTLLEVLLAFVIFALSFATVLEILAGSVRGTTRARDYTEVALLSQSIMDMVGIEIPLLEGSSAGEAPGGYRWQLVISTYEQESPEDRSVELAEVAGALLFWVDLDVSWGDEWRPRQAHFSTVRAVLANRQ
jgi:general secretion pathway protein I